MANITNLTSLALTGGFGIGASGVENFGVSGQFLTSGGSQNSPLVWSSSVTSTGTLSVAALRTGVGNAAAPVITAAGGTSTGIYWAANTMGISVGGTSVATFISTGLSVTGSITSSSQVYTAVGAANAPVLAASSGATTGIYWGSSLIGLSIGGVSFGELGSTGLTLKKSVMIGGLISDMDTTATLLKVGTTSVPSNFSSSTQEGVLIQMEANSNAVTSVIGLRASVTTQGASFTAPYRAQIVTENRAKGATSTITRDIGILINNPNQGGSNAAIADNTAFSGSYFINSTSPNPSLFTGGIVGSATAPATGTVGNEVIFTQGSFQNFPTSTQYGDLGSISLPVGVWDIEVFAQYNDNGSTTSQVNFGIGTVSGNSSSGLAGSTNLYQLNGTALQGQTGQVNRFRVTPAVTTVYYLKYGATFSLGTPTARGTIKAIRR